MMRSLNSDALGQKGEGRFRELCIDARLVPNGVTWDRKGWDFKVDWPFVEGRDIERQSTPRTCLAQVKTVWVETRDISLSLSSFAHIAKDVGPSFITVLRVNDDQTFADAWIAHVRGDLLAHVLRALRKARRDNRAENAEELSLSLNKWFQPVALSGAGLRSALEDAIGPSMSAYVARKEIELRDAGYESGRMIIKTVLEAASIDEITDGFLGLRPIEASHISAQDIRFGIAIPIPEFEANRATLQLKPRDGAPCTVSVRVAPGEASHVFKGELFNAPAQLLGDKQIKSLIRSELFDVRLEGEVVVGARANLRLWLTTKPEAIKKAKLSAGEWHSFYWFVANVLQKSLDIEIGTKKLSQPLRAKMDLDSAESNSSADSYEAAARWTKVASDAFARAGWPGAKLRIAWIGDVRHDLHALDTLIHAPSDLEPVSFALRRPMGVAAFPMLYFNWIRMGDHAIAYAARLEMTASSEGQIERWTSKVPALYDLQRIQSKIGEYNRFVERSRTASGVESYFAANMDAADDNGAVNEA